MTSQTEQPANLQQSVLQQTVLRLAQRAGFALAGLAPVPPLGSAEAEAQADYFSQWIAQGHAGEMEYLKRQDALGRYLRSSVEVAVPWARSILVCAAPYSHGADYPLSTEPAPPDTGWIARYAWSGRSNPEDPASPLVPSDYHKVLLNRLKALERSLREKFGKELGAEPGRKEPEPRTDWKSWAYVDTGPLIERAFTAMAGVGWTGKNVCTLNQSLGSFFFLGVILTSLPLEEQQRASLPADRCGSCTRCIDACPTQALVAPRQMDASRCISYLTIEHRGPIDPALRPGIGRQIFGCDICQDVCPWNARARRDPAPLSADPELIPREPLVNPSLSALASLSLAEWQVMFFGSPVKRTRFEGFRRNLAIAMGNSGDASLLPQLEAWASAEQPDSVLREAAQWAVQQLSRASVTGTGLSVAPEKVTFTPT